MTEQGIDNVYISFYCILVLVDMSIEFLPL